MGWLLHLVQRGGDWAGRSPPINGQCTNHNHSIPLWSPIKIFNLSYTLFVAPCGRKLQGCIANVYRVLENVH